MSLQTITLGGGCFWCIESAFNQVNGIKKAISGYANGNSTQPSYEDVCSGNTGYAEVVQLEFDTDKISLREVLEIFFALHDPTQKDRQGNDVGTQYRSGVYYENEEQKSEALKIISEMTEAEVWPEPIVTEVEALKNYFDAESYHQDYFNSNPQNMYCNMVVAPKLAKFRKTFSEKLRR